MHLEDVVAIDLIADNETNQKIIQAVSEKKKEVQNLTVFTKEQKSWDLVQKEFYDKNLKKAKFEM